MQFDWKPVNDILAAVINAVLPIVLGLGAVAIKRYTDRLKAEIGQKNFGYAVDIATAVVKAAEQNGLATELSQTGAQKKSWALNELEAALKAQGINVDVRMLDTLIEAMVYQEFNKHRRQPIPMPEMAKAK